jgi:hypothetical protein
MVMNSIGLSMRVQDLNSQLSSPRFQENNNNQLIILKRDSSLYVGNR